MTVRWIGVMLLAAVACSGPYSEGQRVGTVTKFSRKGLICKTWEGEMQLQGFRPRGGGGLTANMWEFSVTDPGVAVAVTRALDSERPVTLQYEQVFVRINPCHGSTQYTVTRAIGME